MNPCSAPTKKAKIRHKSARARVPNSGHGEYRSDTSACGRVCLTAVMVDRALTRVRVDARVGACASPWSWWTQR